MKDFLKSSRTKAVLWILCGVAAFLVVFGLGITVGYQKAMFASRWSENYYHNFYGGSRGEFFGQAMDHAPWNTHGVAGTVIDVSSSTISVEDAGNNERSIVILPDTVIRWMNETISLAGVVAGDEITVIGEPNAQGQIQGRFIRILTTSSSMPLPPMPGQNFN